MNKTIDLDKIYIPSEDIVLREIEGELLILPLTAGAANLEDGLYTLNETGKVIWEKLKKRIPVRELIKEITKIFDAPSKEIEKDVVGFLTELCSRKILEEEKPD